MTFPAQFCRECGCRFPPKDGEGRCGPQQWRWLVCWLHWSWKALWK